MSVNPINTPNSIYLKQHIFSLLQCCKATRQLLQLHAQIIVNGFSQKHFILAKLISFCTASADLQHAHKTLNQINSPTTVIWNHVIRGYAKSETPEVSVQLYNQMFILQAEPDAYTYSFTLSACTKKTYLFRAGEQLHGRVLRNGICNNVFVETNLVNMYASSGEVSGVMKASKVFGEMAERSVVTWNSMLVGFLRCGFVDEARRVFDEMPERTVVSWTTMIAGCAQNGRCKQALALFREMWRGGVEVDGVVMVAGLSACAELGDLRTGRWIHSFVDRTPRVKNQPQVVSLDNAIMHMYASCGEIEEAYRVFKEMKRRSVVSWTTIIIGFAKQGRGQEALDVFRWMQSEEGNRMRPDEITFLGVLCACSYTGLVDEGRHYFEYMTRVCGIEPKIAHYGCMVDMLSRAGLLDEAHKLIETMPIKPNDVLWGALLGGCRIYKNSELASEAAQKLTLELEPEKAAGYLVLLSNVYAAGRSWAAVASVRQKMVETSVKKPPGRSWIQVDGVIHDFVAGDETHKHASAIYEMVQKITRQAILEDFMLEKPELRLSVRRTEMVISPYVIGI